MLLAERIALLLLDAEEGSLPSIVNGYSSQILFTTALLCDLTLSGHLVAAEGALLHNSSMPVQQPLLVQLQQALGSQSYPPSRLLKRSTQSLPGLSGKLLENLARRDILHRTPRLRWWPLTGYRYPLRSQRALEEAEQILHRSLHSTYGCADMATLILADACGLLSQLSARGHTQAYAMLDRLDEASLDSEQGILILRLLRQAMLDY